MYTKISWAFSVYTLTIVEMHSRTQKILPKCNSFIDIGIHKTLNSVYIHIFNNLYK